MYSGCAPFFACRQTFSICLSHRYSYSDQIVWISTLPFLRNTIHSFLDNLFPEFRLEDLSRLYLMDFLGSAVCCGIDKAYNSHENMILEYFG